MDMRQRIFMELFHGESFDLIIGSNKFKIDKVNFSGFGATLVHLDKNNKVVTPVYDYHKPVDKNIF